MSAFPRENDTLVEADGKEVLAAKPLDGETLSSSKLQRENSPEENGNGASATSHKVEFSIQVNRGEPSMPVPHAKGFVFALNQQQFRARDVFRAQGMDPWDTASQMGIAFTTGADGKATVLIPPGPLLVVAKADSAYAERWAESAQKSGTLNLEQDLGFQVQVVNEGGEKLVGFPMGIHRYEEGFVSRLGHYLSDSRGEISLGHIQNFLPHEKVRPRVVFSAAAPFRDAPEIELSLDHAPSGVVEYLVPHYGSVRIHLLNEDGSAVSENCRVVLHREYAGQDMLADLLGFQKRIDLGAAEATSQQGEAFFPYVGIGFDIRLGVWFPGAKEPTELVFAGPSQLGTTISVTVEPDADASAIRFRAMDENGLILANKKLSMESYQKQGSLGSSDSTVIHTDASGIGVFPVTSMLEKSISQTIEMDMLVMGSLPELKSRISFEGVLQPGLNDLGDAIFKVGSLACSGILVNEEGSPVGDAYLQLDYADGQTRWHRMDHQNARTDGSGNFVIRGQAFLPQATLTVKHADYPEAKFKINHGSEGLRLVLKTGFEVSGKVLMDADIDASNIRLVVAPSPLPLDPGGAVWEWPNQMLRGSGSFQTRVATSAQRTLVLVDTQSGVLIGKLEQVTPSIPLSGEDTPFIQWDMRGKLSMFSLRFVNSENLPVSQVTIDLEGQFGFSRQVEAEADFWRGSGTLVLPSAQLHFIANAPDLRELHAKVEGSGEHTFVLEDGWPVEVQLFPVEVSKKPCKMFLELEPVREGVPYPNIWGIESDETGTFRFAVPGPGEFRASLHIQLRNQNGDSVERTFPGDESRPLWTIADTPEVQRFELTVDLAEVEAFLEEH